MPQIDVIFDIDANGILNVSAKDLGTGKEQKITISGSGGLGEDEIQRMVKDSESNAEEDQERRQRVEARNRLDQLIYSTEKTLEEHKDKLSSEDQANLGRSLDEAKQALESDDLPTLEKAVTGLTEASHKLAEAMYKDTQPEAQGAALSRRAQEWLKTEWAGESFMAIGMQDPVLGPPVMMGLRKYIKGCPEPFEIADAGHFVQEWGGVVAQKALEVFDL